jgi:hypothetical protein
LIHDKNPEKSQGFEWKGISSKAHLKWQGPCSLGKGQCFYQSFWLVVSTYPSEKYAKVSWDDDIPNIWKVIKAMFQTTNQIYGYSNY